MSLESLSPILGVPGAASVHGIGLEHFDRALHGAAREFLSRPSKAFRARLIQTSFALANGVNGALPEAALEAVELLHGGSLIVDDIEDDAQLRRGGPALHRMIGTPRALNTGNWLYFVALSRLDELPLDDASARGLVRCAHQCLAQCHEGQSLDLALRVGDLAGSELSAIVRGVSVLKTGALTAFAARLGGTLAGAAPRELEMLANFGRDVGVALQMLDDLGSFVHPGRHYKALEDLRNQRLSWVWSWADELLDNRRFDELVTRLMREAELPALITELAEIVEPIGRARVRAALLHAEHGLASVFSPGSALEGVHLELMRLENSYG